MSIPNIFGVTEETTDSGTDSFTALNGPAQETNSAPTGGLVLDLTDEDLDNSASQYVPIPQGTTTQFAIYDIDSQTSKSGYPMWRVTFTVVEDTWGTNKRVNGLIVFHPKTGFNWGPFLKATGLVQSSGRVQIHNLDPQSIIGKVITARVLGYTWKDVSGNYVRNYGQNKKTLPSDGTPYYEDLGNWTAYEPEAEGDLGAVGGFSADTYI